MSGVQSIFTQAYPPILKDYYDSLWLSNLFNSENSDSVSGNEITMTGLSGLAEFTDIAIPVDGFLQFEINNTYATTSKVCQVWVVNGDNVTAVQGAAWCTSGVINFKLTAVEDAESSVTVGFKFLN